jgi:hypothetical protein
MKKATLGDVQASLGEYVKTSATQPVLILRDGEPVAILLGLGGRKKRVSAKLRDVLKRAWKDYENQGGIAHEQFWDDLAVEEG